MEGEEFARYVMEMSETERSVLLRAGLRRVADEYKPGGYKVYPPDKTKDDAVKVEMPEGMADWLVEVAVVDAMDSFIKREQEKGCG